MGEKKLKATDGRMVYCAYILLFYYGKNICDADEKRNWLTLFSTTSFYLVFVNALFTVDESNGFEHYN